MRASSDKTEGDLPHHQGAGGEVEHPRAAGHPGETLGLLTFLMAESGRYATTSTTLAVAGDLASRAAIAIENARLYGELKEADRRKNEFLATLAHELRNPLAPIRNALYLMKQPVDAETAEAERAMAERQVVHLSRLIDDLMDVARISRGRIELQKEIVDLATVVSQAVETSRPQIEERCHRLTVSLPEMPIRLEADPTRLDQILLESPEQRREILRTWRPDSPVSRAARGRRY